MSDRTPAQTFAKAISTATVMLEFSMQKGLTVSDKHILAITQARRLDTPLTDNQEAEFWAAYSEIAQKIRPATAESVLANQGSPKTNPAMKTAAMYRLRTILTMVLLLVSQIYWLIGATVIADLRDIRPRLERLGDQGVDLARVQALLDASLPSETDPTYSAKKNEAEYTRRVQQLKADNDAWNSKLEIEKISAATDFQVLRHWNLLKFLLISTTPVVPRDPSPTADSKTGPEIGPDEYFLWVFTLENLTELRTAEIVLTALIKYLLPILFGALGASAFIVRLLADEIANSTYTDGARVRYQLRFYLGSVAGFSIAWFTSSTSLADTPGMLQSLSPLALAFLAGYSVELLFSLLDRLVTAFSDQKSAVSPQARVVS